MRTPASSLCRSLSLVALAAALIPPAWVGATEPPTPAPGQTVPLHAAGGWPTDTTGDDKKPTRTPEQQANLDSVSNELKRLVRDFGPDSVVLQAKLLVKAMAASPAVATEVGVTGPSKVAGAEYLEINVGTGLHLEAKNTTAQSRRAQVWKDIAAPVLDEMKSFKIQPSGLELVMRYEVADSTTAFPEPKPEGFRAAIPRSVLEKMIVNETTAEAIAASPDFFRPLAN